MQISAIRVPDAFTRDKNLHNSLLQSRQRVFGTASVLLMKYSNTSYEVLKYLLISISVLFKKYWAQLEENKIRMLRQAVTVDMSILEFTFIQKAITGSLYTFCICLLKCFTVNELFY